jgi:hypothetical protein
VETAEIRTAGDDIVPTFAPEERPGGYRGDVVEGLMFA